MELVLGVHAQSLSRVRLFVTSWTVAHQALLSMGFSRQEYWSELPFSTPRDLPDSGIEFTFPALDSLPLSHLGGPHIPRTWVQIIYLAKSLQLCPTLCDPIDGSPPDSPLPGILQARTLEWVAMSFYNA